MADAAPRSAYAGELPPLRLLGQPVRTPGARRRRVDALGSRGRDTPHPGESHRTVSLVRGIGRQGTTPDSPRDGPFGTALACARDHARPPRDGRIRARLGE